MGRGFSDNIAAFVWPLEAIGCHTSVAKEDFEIVDVPAMGTDVEVEQHEDFLGFGYPCGIPSCDVFMWEERGVTDVHIVTTIRWWTFCSGPACSPKSAVQGG